MTKKKPKVEGILMPSGELVAPEDEEGLARAYAELHSLMQDERDLLAVLKDHLARHASQRGDSSFETKAGTVTVKRRNSYKWQPERLGKLLEMGLPPARFDELVTHKAVVNATVANKISSSNPEYKSVILDARELTVTWDVKVG